MPGVEQFSQTVRGSGGTLATSLTGAIETDNYDEGGSINVESADYPLTVNPAETIQELVVIETGSDIRLDITTVSGTEMNDIRLAGASLVLDKIQIDQLTLRDPSATGDATRALWVGE